MLSLSSAKSKIQLAAFGAIVLLLVGIGVLASYIGSKTLSTNHNEQRYGVVEVYVDPALSQNREALMPDLLADLQRLGPTFRRVTAVSEAEIVVNRGELQCDNEGIGNYNPTTHMVTVDPTCIHSDLEFAAVLKHEIGHALGMGHICRSEDLAFRNCSTTGRGLAIMNPTVGRNDNLQIIWLIQPLDIAEFEATSPR